MGAEQLRSVIGTLVVLAYIAFGIYGLWLERRASRFRLEAPPARDRWNPRYYSPEAAVWLRRVRRWERLRTPVWLGLPLAAWLVFALLTR